MHDDDDDVVKIEKKAKHTKDDDTTKQTSYDSTCSGSSGIGLAVCPGWSQSSPRGSRVSRWAAGFSTSC